MTVGNKSKVVAALLAFLLGTTGAHRYYLGYKKQGIIQSCGLVSFILGWAIYVPAMVSENIASLLFALIFLIYGGITSIWAFVDFYPHINGRVEARGWFRLYGESAQTGTGHSTSPSVNDNIDALEKLARLHQQGVLTDEEFEQKKKIFWKKCKTTSRFLLGGGSFSLPKIVFFPREKYKKWQSCHFCSFSLLLDTRPRDGK